MRVAAREPSSRCTHRRPCGGRELFGGVSLGPGDGVGLAVGSCFGVCWCWPVAYKTWRRCLPSSCLYEGIPIAPSEREFVSRFIDV